MLHFNVSLRIFAPQKLQSPKPVLFHTPVDNDTVNHGQRRFPL